MAVILMEQDYWMYNSLSVARFYGGIRLHGVEYRIEGTDLVSLYYIPLLRKMGRPAFMEMLASGVNNLKDAKAYYEAHKANKRKAEHIVEQDLFKEL